MNNIKQRLRKSYHMFYLSLVYWIIAGILPFINLKLIGISIIFSSMFVMTVVKHQKLLLLYELKGETK